MSATTKQGNGEAASGSPFRARTAFNRAAFSIGTETSNIITVGIQLQTANGEDIEERAHVGFFLSDDANGDSVVATGVTSLAAGTDGHYRAGVSNKSGRLVSESDGDIDLAIEYTSGAKTVYLVLEMPDGSLVVSSAITFA
jgi:hypothetical protein